MWRTPMPEPRGQELISRYKLNYGMSNDAPITEDMILCHWDLEKRLRQSLLASTLANRWEVFERCYAQISTHLPWLNNWTAVEKDTTLLSIWRNLIGPPPQNVYEVGSGKGELMAYLATQGYRCRATEITRERGKKWGGEHPNLSWAV